MMGAKVGSGLAQQYEGDGMRTADCLLEMGPVTGTLPGSRPNPLVIHSSVDLGKDPRPAALRQAHSWARTKGCTKVQVLEQAAAI